MKDKEAIRAIKQEDYPDLAEFCVREKMDGRTVDLWIERFKHWWDRNPALYSSFPKGAVLERREGICGVYCCIPVRITMGKEEVVAAIRSTWIVREDSRSQSLALSQWIDEATSGMLSINTTTIDAILPLLEFGDWERVRSRVEAAVVVANWKAAAKKILNMKNTTLSFPVFLSSDSQLTPEKAMEVASKLWEERSSGLRFGPVRDGDYFEWYSLRNPTVSMTWLAFFPENAETPAPIFGLLTNYDDGSLRVLDVWPEDRSVADYFGFFVWLKGEAIARSFHSIRIPMFSKPIRDAAKHFLISRKGFEPQRFFILAPGKNGMRSGEEFWPLNSGDVGI